MKNNGEDSITEAVIWSCSVEKMFLEISQNSQENISARVSFFNKVAGLRHLFFTEHLQWHNIFDIIHNITYNIIYNIT